MKIYDKFEDTDKPCPYCKTKDIAKGRVIGIPHIESNTEWYEVKMHALCLANQYTQAAVYETNKRKERQ